MVRKNCRPKKRPAQIGKAFRKKNQRRIASTHGSRQCYGCNVSENRRSAAGAFNVSFPCFYSETGLSGHDNIADITAGAGIANIVALLLLKLTDQKRTFVHTIKIASFG